MHKVVAINLNGRAFQLDDDAYEAMRVYLERAEHQLRENPDRAEIVGDLEQALADKCQRHLGPEKTVVTLAEVSGILDEMGPVDAGSDAKNPAEPESGKSGQPAQGPTAATKPDPTKRLYRIKEGRAIGGVCTGLAAYFNLELGILRLGFVAVALLDIGFLHTPIAVLVYLALMFLLPEAQTSEEEAAAHGMPFNAQEVIDRAKKIHADIRRELGNSDSWKTKRREWRRRRRALRRDWGHQIAPVSYGARVLAGMTMPLLTTMGAIVGWGGLFVLVTFLYSGRILGWPVPDNLPLWVGAIGILIFSQGINGPIEAARKASHKVVGAPFSAFDGVFSAAVGLLVIWFCYNFMPDARDAVQHLPEVWHNFTGSFRR